MVKGISRQVIVVDSPDKKLFEQAIFILREDALLDGGVTDEALMKEAKRLMRTGAAREKGGALTHSLWAVGGAAATGLLWLLTALV